MPKRRYPIDSEQWLTELAALRGPADRVAIQKAIDLHPEKTPSREKGLGMDAPDEI